MGRRYTLKRTQTVSAGLEEVALFFENPRNLEALTPSFLNFSIETEGEIRMGVGALIDYRISLYGFPMRWRTRIAQYTPGVDFVDLQLKGPYKYWHHLHSFTATKSGTQLNDQVTYELPGGVLGEMVHALMVRKQLRTIFDYRAKVVEARFGSAKTTAAEAKV